MTLKKYWHGKLFEMEQISKDQFDMREISRSNFDLGVGNSVRRQIAGITKPAISVVLNPSGKPSAGLREASAKGLTPVGELLKTYRFPWQRI